MKSRKDRTLQSFVFTLITLFFADTIHFAQVVWKRTAEMGCGMARSTKKNADFVIIVAYYRTPGNGNLPGEFAQNVPPPKYQVRFNTHDSVNGLLA